MTMVREAPKRKASDVAVPERGEDPAERKRILNVLAQRRYRQRRKEHVKTLEAQAGKSRTQSQASSKSPTADSCTITPNTEDATPSGSESITPTLEALVPAAAYFRHVEDFQPDQDQLFDDPFAMFDPNFVAFPTDLQPEWSTMDLPSLPGSPLSATDPSDMSLRSPPSPGSSSRTPTYSFPDEAHLEVLELSVLRGAMTIAKRLNVEDLIWSLTSVSRFTEAPNCVSRALGSAQFQHLPLNLRPTFTQLTYAHHPVLDILPWPTVRDKLILIFSQPPDLRPKCAASPTALIEFVYDIEDSAEGVRIWGDDPYSDQSWEVGEKVFKTWWWAFDSDVIRRSNEMRKQRGARPLGMQEGSVLGEVA